MKTTPYTYLVGWSQIEKFYYGVRYAKGCRPEDLWTTYFTSSKHISKYRQEHGEPDIIEIRKTFDDPIKARLWESKVLDRINAAANTKFINKRNGSWKWATCEMTAETRKKISNTLKGRERTYEHRNAISIARSGIMHTEITKKKISEAQTGKPRPDDFSIKMRNKVWINDGNNNARIDIDDPIPQGWKLGRIKQWKSPSPLIFAYNTETREIVNCSRHEFCINNGYKTANVPIVKSDKVVKYKHWLLSTDAVFALECPV